MSRSIQDALIAVMKHRFPNSFPAGKPIPAEARQILAVLKSILPGAFIGVRITNATALPLLQRMDSRMPGKIIAGNKVDWELAARALLEAHEAALGGELKSTSEAYQLKPTPLPAKPSEQEPSSSAIEGALNLGSLLLEKAAQKARQNAPDAFEAAKVDLGIAKATVEAEEKRFLAAFEKWTSIQNEAFRVLILVSGIIIGLLFTAVFMVELNDWLLGLAIIPILAFSFTILHMLFVTFPLIGHIVAPGGAPDIRRTSGMLQCTLRFFIRLPGKLKMPSRLRDPANDPDGNHILVRINADGKHVEVHLKDTGRLEVCLKAWFTAGIVSSIALVIAYAVDTICGCG